jgi:hypothetical protein
MKPTFIGIGAQKAATTWVYDVLQTHPQVTLSSEKELDFFSKYFDFGYQWYESHFDDTAPSARVCGEVSPSYLCDPAAPERAWRYNKDLKLIAMLRHPVERALSNHRHEVRIGRMTGTDLSFEAGMANNPTYLDQSRYATHLARWLEWFPEEQLLVLLYDDVVADARGTIEKVYRFLEIDASHHSEQESQKSNESYVNKNQGIETAKNLVRGSFKAVGLESVWDAIGKTGLQRLYRKLNRAPSSVVIPQVSAERKAQLASDLSGEVEALEALIKRDLASWKTPGR